VNKRTDGDERRKGPKAAIGTTEILGQLRTVRDQNGPTDRFTGSNEGRLHGRMRVIRQS
jgi:hypothetical protein